MFFSVIVPLYNKKLYVLDTIQSVINQHLSDFEIVIVDDGSTDGSLDEIQAITDKRIRLISQKNSGPGLARNHGASVATGEWLAFIDADDIWTANHLTVIKDLIIRSPKINVVSTTSCQFRHSEARPSYNPIANDICFQIDYLADGGERFVHASSIAIRRSTFLETGGFGAFFPGEDTELWVRLALENPFVISSATTSGYRRATGGIMEQLEKLNQPPADPGEAPVQITLGRALENPNFALRHLAIRTYLDRARFRIARISLVRGYPLVARKHLKAMIDKRRIEYYYYLTLTWIPASSFKKLLSIWSIKKILNR